MSFIYPFFKLFIVVSNTIQCYKLSILSGITYYTYDLYVEFTKEIIQPMYVIHHILSLAILGAACFANNLVIYQTYINIITLFELSGLFCDIYALFPRTDFSRKLLCCGYIPIRCLVIPSVIIVTKPFDNISCFVHICCQLLVCGSIFWGYRLIKTLI